MGGVLGWFRKKPIQAALVAGLTLLVVSGCSASSKPSRTHAVAAVVPLAALPFSDASVNGLPVITVRIGADPPVRLLLDTGSVGIRVSTHALPFGGDSGVYEGPLQVSEEFADGLEFFGPVDTATVTVGGVTTTTPIPLQVVNRVHCRNPRLLFCSGSTPGGIVGIMGIGLHSVPGAEPVNPLENLPAPYDRTWSIALHRHGSLGSGSLVLGASLPRHSAHVTLSRQPATVERTAGWNDRPRLCIFHLFSYCGPTVIDTGTVHMAQNVPHESGFLGNPVAFSGTRITLLTSAYGNPVWTFRASGRQGVNQLAIGQIPPSVWAVPLFYAKTVTYDLVHGVIDLSRQTSQT
ncbi:MAG TPA: DUF3443 family protein [Mycobacteriales bacterium]|nr:DUF3443 family protein [Mycobacteriales bacterium]